jgi:hypothetical protein
VWVAWVPLSITLPARLVSMLSDPSHPRPEAMNDQRYDERPTLLVESFARLRRRESKVPHYFPTATSLHRRQGLSSNAASAGPYEDRPKDMSLIAQQDTSGSGRERAASPEIVGGLRQTSAHGGG